MQAASVLVSVLLAVCSLSSASSDYMQGYYSDSGWRNDGANQWMGSRLKPKCVDIPSNLTLCRGMAYPQMRLPNLLEHDTLAEVTQQAKPWVSLSNIHCHPNTKLFLCSLFSPVCLPDREIWPCRTLCEAVKRGCEVRMNKYGYKWPDMLRCDKFPPDNDLCIGPPPTQPPKDDKACQPCREPDTFEGIVDNYCRADFVGRMTVQRNETQGRDIKITVSKKRYLKKGTSLSRKDLRSKDFYVEGGATCQCRPLNRRRKRGRGRYLMMGMKENGRMVVTLLQKYGKDQRRALRRIKKSPSLCREGPKALGDDSSVVPRTTTKSKSKSKSNSNRKSSSRRRKDGRSSKRRKEGRSGRRTTS